MDKQPMIFVDGLSFKDVPENAPESIRGKLHFKYPDFARFMETHKNDKGWVTITMMKSKTKGTIYFVLDQWKPKSQETTPSSDLTGKDRVNQMSAESVGLSLTDEELKSMEDMPF